MRTIITHSLATTVVAAAMNGFFLGSGFRDLDGQTDTTFAFIYKILKAFKLEST
jgi:hypothetical protein